MAKLINKDEFEKIRKSGKPMAVDFFATWCGPCQMMAPILDEVSVEYKDKNVEIVKVDIDENPELSEEFSVMGVPTFLFIDKEGKEVDKAVGAIPKEMIIQKINTLLE